MHVIVIDLHQWSVDAESAAMARSRLRALPSARVLLVGAGPLPEDLRQACGEHWLNRVEAPVYTLPGRRIPDVRLSLDPHQLGWSFAVMASLQEMQLEQELACVELPTTGALAYASLQERATTDAFLRTRWVLRFDGLRAMDVVRRGDTVELAGLQLMDMERMCVEQCDTLLVESAAVAQSITGFLEGSSQLPMHIASLGDEDGQCAPGDADPTDSGLHCIATEGGSLRQCFRAVVGVLQSTRGLSPRRISVFSEPGIFNDALRTVPPEWRDRFVATAQPVPQVAGGVILPDRWSAGTTLARELRNQGNVLIVNSANVAFSSETGWARDATMLCFANARELVGELLRARTWRPVRHAYSISYSDGSQSSPTFSPGVKVSVVVPFYNLGRWLPHTLANIAKIDWPDLEVIVVDDGSTDPHSREVIDALHEQVPPAVRVVRLPFNQGLAAARNAGVSAAIGEFVLCLDADDLVSPEFVRLGVRALQSDPNAAFVVPRATYFSEEANTHDVATLGHDRPIPMVGAAFESGQFANRFSTATCLARTRVLRALRYDEDLRSYEDWELYRRALRLGYRFIVSNDVHFYYRQRPDSMIHDPAAREKHSILYAEMMSNPMLWMEQSQGSRVSHSVLAAPACLEGSDNGLLLSGVADALAEMKALRRSRIVGLAYKLSAIVRRLRH